MFKTFNMDENLIEPILKSLEEESKYVITNKDSHTLLEWELANGIILLIESLRAMWKYQQSN